MSKKLIFATTDKDCRSARNHELGKAETEGNKLHRSTRRHEGSSSYFAVWRILKCGVDPGAS